ncbi:MAG: BlaI/MecI/CopY family transcriptional regulator [Myxococcota bacterium]
MTSLNWWVPKRTPTPSETQALQFLWERGVATVAELHADICRTGQVGYTTVLKRVQRMEEKGLVQRDGTRGRAHAYRATGQPEKTRSTLVNRLIANAFDNSPNALIQHAIDDHDLSAQDIADIRALLDRIEAEKP